MADGLIRLDEVTRASVASGRLVHLATINPDGTPQVTCVYVGWDEDDIVAGHLADHVKLRNIRRDPRVTLSVESDVPFEGFSPYLQPAVIAVAEAVPFIELTNYDVPRLYELKGEIVSRGIAAITGMKMPVFPKRRFQHGALAESDLRRRLPFRETEYRKQFLSLYS